MKELRRIRVGLALALSKPCLLCDAPPAGAVVFSFGPEMAHELRVLPGSLIFYSLCDACARRPHAAHEAEEQLRNDRRPTAQETP